MPTSLTTVRSPYGSPLAHRRPRRWIYTLLLIFLVSVVITLATSASHWGDMRHMLIVFSLTSAYSTGLFLVNGYGIDWLDGFVQWRTEPGKRLVFTLVISMLGSLLVIFLINYVFLILYLGYKPSVLFDEDALGRYGLPLVFTAVISLIMHSRSFLLSWREALLSNERLQKEMAQAEAETLRQQLDPHFLFNSLNALTSLVEEEPQLAVRFIRQLSQVYRYVLDARGREVVSLRDELEFAEAFLFLQRIRYGEALQATLPGPNSVPAQAVVPPLSLQLLIENALKHNVATAGQPLQLNIELTENGRQLRVHNTLRPRRVAPGESTGIGLPNLTARYRHLTEAPVQIQQTDAEFVVTLPVLELTSA